MRMSARGSWESSASTPKTAWKPSGVPRAGRRRIPVHRYAERGEPTGDLGADAPGADDQRATLAQLADAAAITDEWFTIPPTLSLLGDRDVELAEEEEDAA